MPETTSTASLVFDYGDQGSDIYSTSPLAPCDLDWWDGLDLEALAEAFGAEQVNQERSPAVVDGHGDG